MPCFKVAKPPSRKIDLLVHNILKMSVSIIENGKMWGKEGGVTYS